MIEAVRLAFILPANSPVEESGKRTVAAIPSKHVATPEYPITSDMSLIAAHRLGMEGYLVQDGNHRLARLTQFLGLGAEVIITVFSPFENAGTTALCVRGLKLTKEDGINNIGDFLKMCLENKFYS